MLRPMSAQSQILELFELLRIGIGAKTKPVIPSGASRCFSSRSLLRTRRLAQSRNLSSIFREAAHSFAMISSPLLPAK